MNARPEGIVLDHLTFPEAPRWRGDELWFSDIHAHRVVRTDLDGNASTVAVLDDDRPSGLGWLPDGRMLIVAISSRVLYALSDDGSLEVHANLADVTRGNINDMIVASDGTAFVGDMGVGVFGSHQETPGQTVIVTREGRVSVAPQDLASPNGYILTSDESTLIVAESNGSRLAAFDIRDGSVLENGRAYAELAGPQGQPVFPDGICLDEAGAAWVADPIDGSLLRVAPGGEIAEVVKFDNAIPLACVLGGADRHTLLVCLVRDWRSEQARKSPSGRIEAFTVEVAGAGSP